MERRKFLAGTIAATAAAMTGDAQTQPGPPSLGPEPVPAREFYQLRRYQLQSGPQLALANSFFRDALIPTLSKMRMGPVGAFQLTIGPDTPAYYVLIPSSSTSDLAELDLALARDEEFQKAASPFWNATAAAPAFVRLESWLLAAFEGWPKLTPPAEKGKRIFQLRTYESPSYGDHVRKVEMFHSGEFEIFRNAGFHPVFFGDTLIGSRMPCLTYMLAFKDMAELEAKWDVFRNDPAWKKLSTSPRYASDQIVDNISNLILSPLDCSQV